MVVFFIFSMSAENGTVSNSISVGLTTRLIYFFAPNISNANFLITKKLINKIIRKVAHFSEYFILCGLVYKLLSEIHKYKFLAPGVCAIIAIADEFVVQMNTTGRNSSIMDILIDTAGAIAATALLEIINRRKLRNT